MGWGAGLNIATGGVFGSHSALAEQSSISSGGTGLTSIFLGSVQPRTRRPATARGSAAAEKRVLMPLISFISLATETEDPLPQHRVVADGGARIVLVAQVGCHRRHVANGDGARVHERVVRVAGDDVVLVRV